MRLIVFILASLFSLVAQADVKMYAGNGTGKVIGTYPTFEACVLAGNATGKRFTCKGTITPTPCPAQPPAEIRTQACPSGTTGSWTQTRSYAAAPSPTCWVVGAWLPTTAPVSACVAVPTEPPPIATGSATLSWSAPLTMADGSPLAIDIKEYRIKYGQSSGLYSYSISAIASPAVVPNLLTGSWFFVVSAIDNAGNESENSIEVSKSFQ